jgi:hypothetical protein
MNKKGLSLHAESPFLFLIDPVAGPVRAAAHFLNFFTM